MWIIGLYMILTVINIGIWWKDSIYQAFILTRFFGGNWQTVLLLYLLSLKLRFKQWWKNSCKKVDIKTYELHHIINGKEIKVIIKLKYLSPMIVVVNNCGSDVTSKVIPYLRCSMVSLKPKYVNELSLTICKE